MCTTPNARRWSKAPSLPQMPCGARAIGVRSASTRTGFVPPPARSASIRSASSTPATRWATPSASARSRVTESLHHCADAPGQELVVAKAELLALGLGARCDLEPALEDLLP